MNHLEAFRSDDAKRGRAWKNKNGMLFRRHKDKLQFFSGQEGEWYSYGDTQVAAMEGEVTWADEPKTLTPQDALRALADGKCVRPAGGISDFIYRLDGSELKAWDTRMVPYKWRSSGNVMLRDCLIVPDPSQPAEQYEHIYQARHTKTAEPQVEYPPGRVINRSDIYLAMQSGAVIAPTSYDCMHLRVLDGIPQRKHVCNSEFIWNDSFNGYDGEEYGPTWRIVDGGK